jgi:hypothetical protein
MNPKLLKEVRGLKLLGKSDAEIVGALSGTWQEDQINTCLQALKYMRSEEQSEISQTGSQNKKSDKVPYKQAFIGHITVFILGLVPVFVVALIFGVLFNTLAVSHGHEYMGELTNAFYGPIYLPIATAVFAAFAFITRNWLFLCIPISTYSLGQIIYESDINKYLGGQIPFDMSGAAAYSTVYLVAVILAYILMYSLISPAWKIILLWLKKYDNFNAQLHSQILILALVAVVVFGMCAVGPGLYNNQQRSRAAIHIPKTANYVGQPDTTYYLNYKKQTKTAGSSHEADTVITKPLANWWNTDAQKNCGSSGTDGYQYKKTPKGIEYGMRSIRAQGSQPASQDTYFNTHYYCFVAGNHSYVLMRDDRIGSMDMKDYSSEEVIDAIASSKTYQLGCIHADNILPPRFCTDQDTKDLDALNASIL